METTTFPTFQPYKNEGLNHLYELFFCDNEAAFRANHTSRDAHPWSALFAAMPDATALLQIAEDRSHESRARALAATKLHALGTPPADRELLGVIVEVGMEQGLDALAVYNDGTARYINHSESAVVLEAPNPAVNELINNLWQQSIQVVNRIGPWDKPRLAPPETNSVRLTFLVSGQLYFGQGPINVLFNDPMAKPVLDAATQVMLYLIELSKSK